MTNLRALITQLCDELDHNRQCLLDDRRLTHPLADKARAALAEPEPERPTDEELLATAAASIEPCQDTGIAFGEYELETEGAVEMYGSELIAFARAVLSRWGKFGSTSLSA
jgi:hypothetical protein